MIKPPSLSSCYPLMGMYMLACAYIAALHHLHKLSCRFMQTRHLVCCMQR